MHQLFLVSYTTHTHPRGDVGAWCNGKCLPPKVTSCGFEYENQHLQRNCGRGCLRITNPDIIIIIIVDLEPMALFFTLHV